MAQNVTVPPQAYTRETIVKAYDWLKRQPSSVRDQATNLDRLVGLYLHAQRSSDSNLTILSQPSGWTENLDSVESFKSDLKHLADGLKQFEKTPDAPSVRSEHRPPQSAPTLGHQGKSHFDKKQGDSSMHPQHPNNASEGFVWGAPSPQSPGVAHSSAQPPVGVLSNAVSQAGSPAIGIQSIDERSLKAIRSTQEKFNLSSEGEALRMLISLGYESLKESLGRRSGF